MVELIVWISTVCVATIVWGVRLEGRVNTGEALTNQKHDDLKELIVARFDGVDKRLDRVERSMNGHLVKE